MEGGLIIIRISYILKQKSQPSFMCDFLKNGHIPRKSCYI